VAEKAGGFKQVTLEDLVFKFSTAQQTFGSDRLCTPLSSLVIDIDHDPPADLTREYVGRKPWNVVESGIDG
jgi:hypothetical protein